MLLDLLFDRDEDVETHANTLWDALVESDESTAKNSPNWEGAHRFRYRDMGIMHISHSAADPPLEHGGVPDALPYIQIDYPRDPFEEAIIDDSIDLDQRVEIILDLVRLVYDVSDGLLYGFGTTPALAEAHDYGPVRLPVTEESLDEGAIEYAHWLMVFPPHIVETDGRERLLSAPAYHTERLDDGGVLVVAHSNPASPGPTKPIDDHLGLDSPDIDDGVDY